MKFKTPSTEGCIRSEIAHAKPFRLVFVKKLQLLGWPNQHDRKQHPNENANFIKMGKF